jgi:hypothetical protein
MRFSIATVSARFNAGLVFLAVLGMMGVSLFSPAASAHATATGCTAANPVIDPNVYCATIVGSGTFVNYVSGWFSGGAVVCNSYITAEFFNSNWSWYQTYYSSMTNGCTNSTSKSIGIYAYKHVGYMCSTLHYTSGNFGWRQMSVCHQIHT